ncbi:MAG: Coenzyme F420 hydrogenase/dehydrogenase, beta subunit C-terminal domain [Bacteroides sp]|nr:Coenzyme F420 hydrogenase/dehydrogenase, beta subunit C-terminal domain [Bacteroides sp.]
MIEIKNKKDCCGCHACMTVCPKQCITMVADEEGFVYPKVDMSCCIGCHLCEKVCPVLHQAEPSRPLKVYASMNKNLDIRLKSSSGGLFTLLAESVIRKGGVVFGAKFDEDWNVVHSFTETIGGLAAFRGAKYVQSRMGNTYREVKRFLDEKRWVLFSGTPCQVAGLKNYLRKEYENLLAVDIVCHGVPSPKVWQHYLKSINDTKQRITYLSMRDKKDGWHRYRMEIHAGKQVLYSGQAAYNTYSKGYLANLFLRPSCHACPARSGKSRSDITLGDFWGLQRYHPSFDDRKGTNLVLINTPQGLNHYRQSDVYQIETTYEMGIRENGCIEHSVPYPSLRNEFWNRFPEEGIGLIDKLYRKKNRIWYRIWNWCCNGNKT